LPGFLSWVISRGLLPHDRKNNGKSCNSFLPQSLVSHRRGYLHLKEEEEEKAV